MRSQIMVPAVPEQRKVGKPLANARLETLGMDHGFAEGEPGDQQVNGKRDRNARHLPGKGGARVEKVSRYGIGNQ